MHPHAQPEPAEAPTLDHARRLERGKKHTELAQKQLWPAFGEMIMAAVRTAQSSQGLPVEQQLEALRQVRDELVNSYLRDPEVKAPKDVTAAQVAVAIGWVNGSEDVELLAQLRESPEISFGMAPDLQSIASAEGLLATFPPRWHALVADDRVVTRTISPTRWMVELLPEADPAASLVGVQRWKQGVPGFNKVIAQVLEKTPPDLAACFYMDNARDVPGSISESQALNHLSAAVEALYPPILANGELAQPAEQRTTILVLPAALSRQEIASAARLGYARGAAPTSLTVFVPDAAEATNMLMESFPPDFGPVENDDPLVKGALSPSDTYSGAVGQVFRSAVAISTQPVGGDQIATWLPQPKVEEPAPAIEGTQEVAPDLKMQLTATGSPTDAPMGSGQMARGEQPPQAIEGDEGPAADGSARQSEPAKDGERPPGAQAIAPHPGPAVEVVAPQEVEAAQEPVPMGVTVQHGSAAVTMPQVVEPVEDTEPAEGSEVQLTQENPVGFAHEELSSQEQAYLARLARAKDHAALAEEMLDPALAEWADKGRQAAREMAGEDPATAVEHYLRVVDEAVQSRISDSVAANYAEADLTAVVGIGWVRGSESAALLGQLRERPSLGLRAMPPDVQHLSRVFASGARFNSAQAAQFADERFVVRYAREGHFSEILPVTMPILHRHQILDARTPQPIGSGEHQRDVAPDTYESGLYFLAPNAIPKTKGGDGQVGSDGDGTNQNMGAYCDAVARIYPPITSQGEPIVEAEQRVLVAKQRDGLDPSELIKSAAKHMPEPTAVEVHTVSGARDEHVAKWEEFFGDDDVPVTYHSIVPPAQRQSTRETAAERPIVGPSGPTTTGAGQLFIYTPAHLRGSRPHPRVN